MANKGISKDDGLSPLGRDPAAVEAFLAYLRYKCDILREQINEGAQGVVFSMDVKVATQVAHLVGQRHELETLISDINKTLRV